MNCDSSHYLSSTEKCNNNFGRIRMGRQRSCFHVFLAFILKFLNYLQTFMGVSMIIYSCFMLNRWRHQRHVPSSPVPAPFPFDFSDPDSVILLPQDVTPLSLDHLDFAGDLSGLDVLQFNSYRLPTPWYPFSVSELVY